MAVVRYRYRTFVGALGGLGRATFEYKRGNMFFLSPASRVTYNT